MPTVLAEYDIPNPQVVTVAEVQALVEQSLQALRDPDSLESQLARKHDIDVSQLPPHPEELLDVRAPAEGFEPGTALVVFLVAATPFLNTVAKDLWRHVILYKIRVKWGDLAPKERPSAAAKAAAVPPPAAPPPAGKA